MFLEKALFYIDNNTIPYLFLHTVNRVIGIFLVKYCTCEIKFEKPRCFDCKKSSVRLPCQDVSMPAWHNDWKPLHYTVVGGSGPQWTLILVQWECQLWFCPVWRKKNGIFRSLSDITLLTKKQEIIKTVCKIIHLHFVCFFNFAGIRSGKCVLTKWWDYGWTIQCLISMFQYHSRKTRGLDHCNDIR